MADTKNSCGAYDPTDIPKTYYGYRATDVALNDDTLTFYIDERKLEAHFGDEQQVWPACPTDWIIGGEQEGVGIVYLHEEYRDRYPWLRELPYTTKIPFEEAVAPNTVFEMPVEVRDKTEAGLVLRVKGANGDVKVPLDFTEQWHVWMLGEQKLEDLPVGWAGTLHLSATLLLWHDVPFPHSRSRRKGDLIRRLVGLLASELDDRALAEEVGKAALEALAKARAS